MFSLLRELVERPGYRRIVMAKVLAYQNDDIKGQSGCAILKRLLI